MNAVLSGSSPKFRYSDLPVGEWVSLVLHNPVEAESQYMRYPDCFGYFVVFDACFSHDEKARPIRLLLPLVPFQNATAHLPRSSLKASYGKDVIVELRKLEGGRMEVRKWEPINS